MDEKYISEVQIELIRLFKLRGYSGEEARLLSDTAKQVMKDYSVPHEQQSQ